MSRRRYISTKISTDRQINKLATQYGDFAVLLYTWMIPHAEDNTEITGDYDELLMIICPGRRDKTPEDVEHAIQGMLELGLLQQVERDGSPMLAFPAESFYSYQTYIKKENRRKTPENTGEHREVPKNTVSLSPSHSLSLSPSLSEKEKEQEEELSKSKKSTPPPATVSLVKIYEKETGRPITPLEAEQITTWTVRFPDDIILEALKRAVAKGVLKLSYIDKILLDWEKRNLRTLREVLEYEAQAEKHRAKNCKLSTPPTIPLPKKYSEAEIQGVATFIKMHYDEWVATLPRTPTDKEIQLFLRHERFDYDPELKSKALERLGLLVYYQEKGG